MKKPAADPQNSLLKGVHAANETLLEQEGDQLLASIIEFLPDATFVIDRNKRIVAWNHACEVMTGVRNEALLGKRDQE